MDTHENGSQLIKSIKSFQNQTVLELFRSYPDKKTFYNLMTLFQYPSLFSRNQNQSVFLDLSIKFASAVKIQRTLRSHNTLEVRRITNLNFVLSEAYECFFEYSNKIFHVFIRSHFDISLKKDPLKIAILLVGLSHMEKNGTTNYLTGYFKSKLRVHFGVPHSIKPTLQNIQAISILLFYSHSINWVYSKFTNYLAYCAKAVHILGLDYCPKNTHGYMLLERVMLYSCITMLQTFIILITRFYLSMPQKPAYLPYEYFNIRNSLKNIKGLISVNDESFDVYCKVTICSFYCDSSLIVFHVRLLKESYIMYNEENTRTKETTMLLMNKIKSIKEHYFVAISQLGIMPYLKALDPLIQVYGNIILFICHFLKFFLLSLKFYHPTQLNNNQFPTQSSSENGSGYLKEVLMECQLAIIYGTRLKGADMFSFGLGIITQYTIFLIRYKVKSNINFDTTIENGLNYLKQSSEIEVFNSMATINTNIIEYIKTKYI